MPARRGLALAFTLSTLSNAFVICACGETASPSSPPAENPDSGRPVTPGKDPSGNSPTSDAGADAGIKRAPTGCILQSTGLTEGTRAESVARSDAPNAAAWINPANALAADGAFATVTLAEGQESALLRVSSFGFTVPSTAETWGLEVELKRQAPDGGISDARIDVEIEGKPSRFKLISAPWPTTIVGTHVYGQAVDTWGVDLFPADVNKPSFAATLTVKRAPGATGVVTATVESLKAAVSYCPEPIKK